MMMIFVDSLCEEERMNRNYCTECGSYKTASLEFISHSFSLMKLKFLYQHVLPDLTGKVVVDVGSRVGAELFVLSIPSPWSRNADFCQLQEMSITKYQLIDRIKTSVFRLHFFRRLMFVVVMNNVFEYFLDRLEQARAWEFIACNVKKRGSLVTAPSLKDLLSKLQTDIQLSQWVVEVQLNYDLTSPPSSQSQDQAVVQPEASRSATREELEYRGQQTGIAFCPDWFTWICLAAPLCHWIPASSWELGEGQEKMIVTLQLSLPVQDSTRM
ncbi:Methyltransf-11 domain-containing protein [Aix galericulata]|nr:Methyltransf-11 domain-containing protein [Aix galericulata]